MKKEIEIPFYPEHAFTNIDFIADISKFTGVNQKRITGYQIIKRSIDGRSQSVKVRICFEITIDEPFQKNKLRIFDFQDVHNKPTVNIIGAGPAGLFAALQLIERGLKPIIIERGKPCSERKIDIALLYKEKIINADSNYCFGVGGAGTFSDGKLYTRSSKRGDVNRILQLLVNHGANPNVLIDAHPHIGSDKLPAIITNICKTITDAGGEIYFNEKVIDFKIKDDQIKSVKTSSGRVFEATNTLLATGHSARDIYELLNEKKINIEAKSFAAGIRIEHPQALIDEIQYHTQKKDAFLPAATYRIVTQALNRGVFSFCMCPGGTIVPAMTGNHEMVTNGMSNSNRNSPFANAGIVVSIELDDIGDYINKYGPLGGLVFQSSMESRAFETTGNIMAPAQRLTDFMNKKESSSLNPSSYIPGLVSVPLHTSLPDFITTRIQIAFKEFEKKMKGFITEQAMVLGVESRTSSPVRIPRDHTLLSHPQFANFYPCGEGAGFAGGIVSSAIDGERCALKIIEKYCD